MICRILTSLFLALLVAGCAKPTVSYEVSGDGEDGYVTDDLYASSTVSISALKNRYLGSSHPIVDDLVIEGRVVANDMYGEYYKALIVEDSTGAIELRIDSYDLYNSYPIGALLRVVCDDLWLSNSGGTIMVGAEPEADDYLVGYLSGDLLARSVLFADDSIESISATEITIPQLTISMVSCRVMLRNVVFRDSDLTTFAYRDPESGRYVDTSHVVCDSDGNEIELQISSTASYAEVAVPKYETDFEAIVEYSSGAFSLRLVSFMIKL